MRSVLPLQGAWVQLLVGKLESHVLHGEARKNTEAFLTLKKKCRQSLQATPATHAVLVLEGDFLEMEAVSGAIG